MSKIDELTINVNCEQKPSNAPHIEIKQEGMTANVFIDGQKVNGVRKINFEYECTNCIPVLQLEFLATDMAIDGIIAPDLPEVLKPFYKKVDKE